MVACCARAFFNRLGLLLFCCLLFAAAANSQCQPVHCLNLKLLLPVVQDLTKASAQSDAQAIQLLNSAFLAIGGAQKASLADIQIEGTMSWPSAPEIVLGTFVAKARGEDWAFDANAGGHSSKYRLLGGSATLNQDGSTKFFHPAITYGTRLDLFPLFQRWTEFNQPGSVATIVGQASLDGKTLTDIHVRSGTTTPDPRHANPHGEVDVLIDPSAGLVAAVRFKAMLGMPKPRLVDVEIRFSQYQQLGGLLVPAQVTRYVAGQPVMLFHITGARSNNGFTDDDFRNQGGGQ